MRALPETMPATRRDSVPRKLAAIASNRRAGRGALHIGAPLAVYGLLVCLRIPGIITGGRFWAEEGQHFFVNAWVLPTAAALFTSFGGYLNLIANAAPLAARWLMPLPLAPYVTIAIGLVFQLCPPLLLLTARDAWLRPRHVRLAALLLLLLVPASEEIWLQTLHCQFELLLCGGIILALDVATGWRALLRLGVLVLAPLTGPVVIAILPLFLLRAAWDRSWPRLVQASALGAAALVQLLLFFHAVPGRGYALHPALLLCAFTVRHLALPLLGVARADMIADSIRATLNASRLPLMAIILPIPVAAALIAVSLRQRAARPAFWFLCAGGMIAVASYFGAIGGVPSLLHHVRGQERYVVVPQSLFYLAVLVLATTASGWRRRLGWAVVFWLLCLGAYAFVTPLENVTRGPSWRDEVALWRADPSHVLQIWPVGWSMKLPPQ
jgi:hypothetical protein